ncbi:MAG: hypothetical protein QOG68_1627 [Solirubrobacteraceae bacterium]|nr:hypothetical protein [Solirubrobacteraceae bacterium]
MLRAPIDAVISAGYLRSLPRLTMALDGSPAAQRLHRDLLSGRVVAPGWRLAQAVQQIPPQEGAYLRGRHRQALRTNAHHAHEAGWRYDVAVPGTTLGDKAAAIGPRGDLAVAAISPAGEVGVLGVCLLSGRWAGLTFFRNVGGPTPARYGLHAYLVEQLRRRWITHLHGGSALGSRGLRYYQERLGFEAVNLRLVVAAPGPAGDYSSRRDPTRTTVAPSSAATA